jgi:alanine dehydrogenase
MLLINNELVSQLLTMDDCIRVQEEAFRKLATGGAIHRPRIDMYFPCERADGYFRGAPWKARTTAISPSQKSDIITWPMDGNGSWTEDKYCREPGPVRPDLLVSTHNGEPLAFINDGVLHTLSRRRQRHLSG